MTSLLIILTYFDDKKIKQHSVFVLFCNDYNIVREAVNKKKSVNFLGRLSKRGGEVRILYISKTFLLTACLIGFGIVIYLF